MSLLDWNPERLEGLLVELESRPVPAALIRDVTEPLCLACGGEGFVARDRFGVCDPCPACERRAEEIHG